MKRYIAKPNTWFDEGTEAIPITEFFEGYDDSALTIYNPWALFEGIRNGKLDQEECTLDEFEVINEE